MFEFEEIDKIEVPDHGPDCYDFGVLFEQSDESSLRPRRINIVELVDGEVLNESVLTDMEIRENSKYIDPTEGHY